MRIASLVWGAALCSCVGAFIVPDQLVSLLTVVYSVIPPIKKGTDSRLGFGYRFGPFADFQVLLELGPQTETRPIGGQAAGSGKRDVEVDADPDKRPDIQVLDGPPRSNSRSARSGPVPASAPAAPEPPPPAASSDWLSRWRSGLSAAPVAAVPPSPPPQARLYKVQSRPRPARAPAASLTAPGYAVAAPVAPQGGTMSAESRWEAMQRLRSLHWAGQQQG